MSNRGYVVLRQEVAASGVEMPLYVVVDSFTARSSEHAVQLAAQSYDLDYGDEVTLIAVAETHWHEATVRAKMKKQLEFTQQKSSQPDEEDEAPTDSL